MIGVFHFSTSYTKKEKKKQKEKEIPAATNLNFQECCVDKREQFRVPVAQDDPLLAASQQ
jgi:hypothetical protein